MVMGGSAPKECSQGLRGKVAGYRNNLTEAAICLDAGVRLHKGRGRNPDFSSLWKVFICLLFFFFFSFFKKKRQTIIAHLENQELQ